MAVKKFIVSILLVALMILGFSIAAEEDIKVMLNGSELVFDVPSQLINGRTMVPVRVIFEALDAKVEWFDGSEIINSYLADGSMIRLTVGSDEFIVRTKFAELKYITLDTPPQIIDNRTLVPVRAIAESVGAYVDWNDEAKTVNVSYITETLFDEVTISTVEEFISAVHSNVNINVVPGVYDFEKFVTAPIFPIGGVIGVNISGVKNLNIIGSPDGDTKFINTAEPGNVLNFENCENINIESINFIDNGLHLWKSSYISVKHITSPSIYVGGGSNNIL